MPKITEYLLQDSFPDEDKRMLHVPAMAVPMRIFQSSGLYRQLIIDVTQYMDAHLNMVFEDYANVRGVSAVQLGIPFSIIGFKCKGKNKFCINPKIIRRSKEGETTKTNCGSIRLKEDVTVFRNNLIDIEYFDLKGQRMIEKNVGKFEGGWVIQHEVDHCLGICVTDREVKPEKPEVKPTPVINLIDSTQL